MFLEKRLLWRDAPTVSKEDDDSRRDDPLSRRYRLAPRESLDESLCDAEKSRRRASTPRNGLSEKLDDKLRRRITRATFEYP
jgi:hypothetical protein